MYLITAAALLVMLIIPEGISVGERCQCIHKERRPIGRHLGAVEVRAPNSHCSRVEIIATVKISGEMVCLEPELPWVKRVLELKKAAEAREAEERARL